MPRVPPYKTCLHCGTTVLPHQKLSRKQWDETRYCSISCSRKATEGDPEERFWRSVDKTPGHGPWGDCWLWTGSRFELGYGRFCDDGVIEQSHRRSYRKAKDTTIQPGIGICHRCDNPPCVNPDHLFEGTPKANHDDKVAKGRQTQGEASPFAKLTEAAVLEIRASSESGSVLAKRYGVAKNVILKAKRGDTWKHVDAIAAKVAAQ